MSCKNDVVSVFLLLLAPFAAAQTAPPPFPGFSEGPVFNPTMAIIMIIFVSAFFSLGFFSVYIRHCAERRFRNAAASDADLLFGDNRRSWRATRGISSEVIGTFPTFRYSTVKGLKIGKGALECAVCLNEFEDDETLRLMPICCHVFHADCVDAWLSSHNTCPVCRANLMPKPREDLASTTVQILDPDGDYGEPEPDPNSTRNPDTVLWSPEGNTLTNQNRPPRTGSTGVRVNELFPRSHTTGHSLVQPGGNVERFTLRLPEDVRRQIMTPSSNLNRARSIGVLPRARSERRGYRSGSVGRSNFQFERFDQEVRPDRWSLSLVPPFFSRTGSVRSTRSPGGGEEAVDGRNLLPTYRNPADGLYRGSDNIGERSSDRLV